MDFHKSFKNATEIGRTLDFEMGKYKNLKSLIFMEFVLDLKVW